MFFIGEIIVGDKFVYGFDSKVLEYFSQVDKKGSETGAEKRFKQLSIGERKKVDIESLVNFNGVEEERASTHKANKLEKNYIVVSSSFLESLHFLYNNSFVCYNKPY